MSFDQIYTVYGDSWVIDEMVRLKFRSCIEGEFINQGNNENIIHCPLDK